MSRLRIPVLAGLLLVVASSAVLLCAFDAHYVNLQADEPLLAWLSKRALTGQTPYTDFFCFYPPLSVYGLKWFFQVFGATLGALRLLTVSWLLGTTLLLYVLLLRFRIAVFWSAAIAFQLPAFIIPFWPIPSHHWFALGLGLAALALVAGLEGAGRPARWIACGVLAGLAGLCLQTDGLLFAALALLFLPWENGARPAFRRGTWFALGLAVPLLATGLILAGLDALRSAWECLAVWPAHYYKQPGGFNDVAPFQFLSALWASRVPAHFSAAGLATLITYSAGLSLPFVAALSAALSPAWLSPATVPPIRFLRALCGLLLTLATYLHGRCDWTHLVLLLPLVLLLMATGVDWERERLRPGALKAFFLFLLIWASARWTIQAIRKPPLVHRVLEVDALWKLEGPAAVLSGLPKVKGERPPVVFLPYGSSLYFFWAPDPPPLDWLFPPSSKHDAPEDNLRLAEFLDRRSIPCILIQDRYDGAFQDEASPLADVLGRSYRAAGETPWGRLFVRKEPPVPNGAAGGGTSVR